MCRIMVNSASRDLIFGFRNRNEKLEQIQTLTNNVENNERKIVEIDNKIKTAENIIVAHERIIKDTENLIFNNEALISNNEAIISNNERIIKTTEELLNCYKSLLANNECQKNSSTDVSNTIEERIISSTAYQKVKQDLIDLNSDLKNNKQLIKIVEKKSSITTDQSVNDSKTRMTAYNILNNYFNNFRLKYLSSMHWF